MDISLEMVLQYWLVKNTMAAIKQPKSEILSDTYDLDDHPSGWLVTVVIPN